MLDEIGAQMSREGSFLLRSGTDRTVMGFGIAEEWRAYTLEQALAMLQDLRTVSAWRVGYLSYELGALWQGVKSRKWAADTLPRTPLLHFIVPEEVYVYDEVEFDLEWVPRDMYFDASKPRAGMTFLRYQKSLSRIKSLLRAGETYEVNFARRWRGSFEGNPLEVFRRLHGLNPSPHAAFLNFQPLTVVSNSPERLISGRRDGRGRMVLETSPIKGTVPRGSTPAQDARNIRRLFDSSKDEAELNMIVDLARNDLGRVSEFGSVQVPLHRVLESYSHVHHTVSHVQGVLRSELDWLDALQSVFPGGSITGAPKQRTMEIIQSLEPCPRGIYTGSAGWISPEGEFDFNILIRTLSFYREGEGVLPRGSYVFHSGGGIVADSNARAEYEETVHKAAALEMALEGGILCA